MARNTRNYRRKSTVRTSQNNLDIGLNQFSDRTHDPLSPTLLENKLGAALLQGLSFPNRCVKLLNEQELFSAYIESVKELSVRREEFLQLIQAIKRASFDIPATISPDDPHVQRRIEELFATEFLVSLDQPLNIANATLASLPLDEQRKRFRQAISKATETFAQQVVRELNSLVDRRVVGLLDWPSQNSVKYHYYRRRVVVDNVTLNTKQLEASDPRVREVSDMFAPQVRTSLETKTTSLTFVLELHVHEAISAFQTGLDNTQVVIPANVEELIQAIPFWMKPCVQVVDGFLIREQVSELSRRKEQVVVERVIEEPILGCEPAVALGPFVLIGWGPREIDAVRSIQRQNKRASDHARHRQNAVIGAATSLTFAFLFATSSANRGLVAVVAPILLLVAIPFLVLGLRSHLAIRLQKFSEVLFQIAAAGVVLLMTGLCLILLSRSNAAIGVAVLFVLMGGLVNYASLKRMFAGIAN